MSGITRAFLVLDSSGSMGSAKQATIDAINSIIDETAANSVKYNQDTRVGLIVFGRNLGDVTVQVPLTPLDAALIAQLKLNGDNYKPYGDTPLYDAIGRAIDVMSEIPVGEEDAFLVQVFTDGMENASRSHWRDGSALSRKIIELQNTGRWTFTFSGANIDVEKLGRELHIPQHNLNSFQYNSTGIRGMSASHSHGLETYYAARSSGSNSVADFYGTDGTNHGHTLFDQTGQQVGHQVNITASPQLTVDLKAGILDEEANEVLASKTKK